MAKVEFTPKDLAEEILEIRAIEAEVIEKAKALGFRPFAYPPVPKDLQQYIFVRWGDQIYSMADEGLEGVPEEELEPIPPVDIAAMKNNVLGMLMQYWTGLAVAQRTNLAIIKNAMDMREKEYQQIRKIRLAQLLGTKDSVTNKVLSDDRRKEVAENDYDTRHALMVFLKQKSLHEVAEAVHKGVQTVVESLNRQRMLRDQETRAATGTPGWPRDESTVGGRGRPMRHSPGPVVPPAEDDE